MDQRATEAGSDTAEPAAPALFERSYGFSFDPFQRRACESLVDGSSVLVAAPTGAGKTVVGEFAAWLALRGGGKTFYTTPIKALSNQKFGDFVAAHGAQNVGLLTGDNSVNGDAPIVVMTTEVLRNMIYEDSSALQGLRFVVLDEVHYLQDRYRGGVWEEILIHLPVEVQIVSLSATVSNAEEFADWLQTLRGRTEVIIEEHRPVELRHWYFASDELLPMFVRRPDGSVVPNPRGAELERRKRVRDNNKRPQRGERRTSMKRPRIPWRTEVVERLDSEGMLPAIYFIFSRKGCAEAVKQCLREGLRLTTNEERAEIFAYAESRVVDLTPAELSILGYDEFLGGLERGLAAHHAGMIPPFKEIVEELFARGVVKVVFATETLALGINMPARSVVIESLMKFTGETHELMTAGQFTQLSGRAGRRGIDELGHAVVLMQRSVEFQGITRLATTRTYPLRSSFQPSYNMAVNLVRTYDFEEAEHLVNSSFAQFQSNRGVVRLERDREELEAYLASYRDRMECDLGDFAEFRELTQRLQKLEAEHRPQKRSGGVAQALSALSVGDVIEVSAGKRRGRYGVIEVSQSRSERRPRVLALSKKGSLIRLIPADLPLPPVRLGRLDQFWRRRVRDAAMREEMARAISVFPSLDAPAEVPPPADPEEMKALKKAIESHPVRKCQELGRHQHFASRAKGVERRLANKDREIARIEGTLARRFEQVLSVLEQLGYVDGWSLTRKGDTLTAVYNESELLVVETLAEGVLEDLDPPEIAALCSSLVYETRGPDAPAPEGMPTKNSSAGWKTLIRLWREIKSDEEDRGLDLTREPDPGFAPRAYKWASGHPLEEVLGDEDAPGDFVRSVKQLVDLLRQMQEVAPTQELMEKIGVAVAGLHRGIVAYSSLEI